jgi:hypothetical protein
MDSHLAVEEQENASTPATLFSSELSTTAAAAATAVVSKPTEKNEETSTPSGDLSSCTAPTTAASAAGAKKFGNSKKGKQTQAKQRLPNDNKSNTANNERHNLNKVRALQLKLLRNVLSDRF